MKTAKSLTAIVLLISLVACTTDQILADLNIALQIAAEIIPSVMAISPADGNAIQKVSAAASTGLGAINSAYKAYKATESKGDLQALETALDNFKGNLNQVIAAAQIKNPASQAKILAWANLIYSVTDAIISAIPQAKASGAMSPRTMKKLAPLPKPEDLKSRWKAIKG